MALNARFRVSFESGGQAEATATGDRDKVEISVFDGVDQADLSLTQQEAREMAEVLRRAICFAKKGEESSS